MKKIIEELEKLANKALKHGDVPVGALLVKSGKIIAKGYNKVEKTKDLTAHAEVVAIKRAIKQLKTTNLSTCELYVSLEPCLMCKEVIARAKIPKVYYFVDKEFKKGFLPKYNKIIDSEKESEMSELLKLFFVKIREVKR